MSDQDPSRQNPALLGPSGTQRLNNDKPKTPEPAPVLSELMTKAFLIRDRTGQGEQARVPLAKSRTVVGRGSADVIIDDETISSQHFAIEHGEDGSYTIQDLGSSNGTVVNGSEIQTATLTSGDRIQVGKTGLVFRTIQTIPWSESS